MNSKSITSFDIGRAVVSAGFKITDNDEIAVQKKLQIKDFALGQFQVGYHRRISDNLETKIKIDNVGTWTLFTRYRTPRGLSIGTSIQSSCGKSLTGIGSQPVNFGLRITHNS